jgi:pyruvate dehydrogenase kinase 2/3/4
MKYLKSFQKFPYPSNEQQELAFTDMLRPMVLDRTSIPMAIARGLASLKDRRKEELDVRRLQLMEMALYRFFSARIGLRLLTEHHILSCRERSHENEQLKTLQSSFEHIPLIHQNDPDYFGCIQSNCNPVLEAKRVAEQVKRHCNDCYGITPDIEILDCTPDHFSHLEFTYVTHHLQYMLAELLKNSCRATIRRYLEGKITKEDHSSLHGLYEGTNHHDTIVQDSSLPSIRVVIVKGAEDVTIKVADQGGGVTRSVIDKMWTFSHSTLTDEIQSKEYDTDFEMDEFTGGNIRGFGLPLARIYARYFGGELTLKSMEGYGVDAYIYLPVLGSACENLPERVLLSPSNHDSVHDGNFTHLNYDLKNIEKISGDEPWNVSSRNYSTTSPLDRLNKVAL